MQPPFPGKDAFHRVPDFAQKRFAICHLPSAIRATIFGACYLVGSAGHARRSENKQQQ
jgi:hypothetical protein